MRADALDGDVREILASDFLELAVGVAEVNELGEGARLAGRCEPVEPIALTADYQPLQSEHGIFGRTDGGSFGLSIAHWENEESDLHPGKSLRQVDIGIKPSI